MVYESESALVAEAILLVAYWQPKLLLQEWRIRVQAKGLESKRARIDFNNESMVADLHVSPDYWLGREPVSLVVAEAKHWTLEESIIHELLHLRVDPLVTAKEEEREEEEDRLCNLLARTLKGLREEIPGTVNQNGDILMSYARMQADVSTNGR